MKRQQMQQKILRFLIPSRLEDGDLFAMAISNKHNLTHTHTQQTLPGGGALS